MISKRTLTNIIMTSAFSVGYLILKLLMLTDILETSSSTKTIEILFFLSTLPFFFRMVRDHLIRAQDAEKLNNYTNKLNLTLINQSHNPVFYDGDLLECSKILTKDVVENLGVDRCGIWLYNDQTKSIELDMLYKLSDNDWSTGGSLEYSDYLSYFNELLTNPVIVADDAETNLATECLHESYLKPLGIKSLIDVPILFRGETIGVICIESYTKRNWIDTEVNFAQVLSSLYSFSWSIADGNDTKKNLVEIENFMDTAMLVSKTNKRGRITYVNEKFTKVSGWKTKEVMGKDHQILSSGIHNKEFWKNMYTTTINKREIWNEVVTNKSKDGHHYFVDTYIKADFDPETNEHIGFTSIRQDVTKIVDASIEIEKKNTYLEHAAKILRHDMHSGINTYIPKGINSLIRRLKPEIIKEYKLEAPIRLLKEGLTHTQRVYKGVYEFTNLVKKDSVLEIEPYNIKEILNRYLESTAYKEAVILSDNLPTIEVNESLFCTAIDNLIRNGLKYNDSPTRIVKIYHDTDDTIAIQDNGRGLTQEEFDIYSKPYARKADQKESGTGLGLNICIAILKEHGFKVSCEKVDIGGTKIKIKYKND
jgi:PAS domain S-box-containing protein